MVHEAMNLGCRRKQVLNGGWTVMPRVFGVGDHVTWNSEAGRVAEVIYD
jgi:hypothetical protein